MPVASRSFINSRPSVRRSVAAPQRPKYGIAGMLPGNQQLLRSAALHIQPKLRLSQEGDPAERQADAVAEQIVANEHAAGSINPTDLQVNRACSRCEEEVQRAEDPEAETEEGSEAPIEEEIEEDETGDEGDESGMPKRDGTSSATVSDVVIPRGAGAPMSRDVLNRMEFGFGENLGQVRIHSDQASARSARQMGALAYTVGNHVYFGAGRYSPNTTSGTRLLAHELTHVVQQGAEQSVSRKESDRKNVCGAGNCSQGKQKKQVSDDCDRGEPADKSKYIKHLEVSISGHIVTATWSDSSKDTWPCSGNASHTPKGPDVVGLKCSINHTNMITKKRKVPDGMAWFTGFDAQGKRIGFHDSQPVGSGFKSHGCVRVCCDIAKLINQNSWSGKTTIHVT